MYCNILLPKVQYEEILYHISFVDPKVKLDLVVYHSSGVVGPISIPSIQEVA